MHFDVEPGLSPVQGISSQDRELLWLLAFGQGKTLKLRALGMEAQEAGGGGGLCSVYLYSVQHLAVLGLRQQRHGAQEIGQEATKHNA